MYQFKSLPALVIAACLSVFPITSLAHLTIACNASFVKAHPTQLLIDVLPNGMDDTDNIQCALDEAAQKGVPVVRLAKGNFSISNIMVENFKGSFQGTTRADTQLAIRNNSIDCSGPDFSNRMDAAIKFTNGEPTLRFMTISSDLPCSGGATIRAIVHFTGDQMFAPDCKNDVIFGLVDRVDMVGPGRRVDLKQAAIQSSPEGIHHFGNCKQTLLGSFKVNQSTVTGYETGVFTSMKAGAQVDINFNTFTNNRVGVWVQDSNQSTTITGNTFASQNTDENISGLNAISIIKRSSTAPVKTRVVIHNNQFMFTDLEGVASNLHRGSIFRTHFSDGVQDVSLSITDNHFQVTGDNFFILEIRDIENWVISGNIFTGHVNTGITTINFNKSSVSGAVIVANSFKNLNSDFADIYLDDKTTKCIVGARQHATVTNDGTANNIL